MDGIGIIGLAGTVVTTAGTVAVAYLTNRNRQEQQHRNKENMQAVDKIESNILNSIDELRTELRQNNQVTVATARSSINQIYEINKAKKEISPQDWRSVVEIYEAYKKTTVDGHIPNSWCDEIVDEMRTWKKI